ncbi:MAG: hypothetical protein HY423_15350 [Candidatus Lambdaproteobacteria bacterium]|nr:hypothetical protein [Candidatus Lambdaproteobacteria bacterium]
MLDTLKYAKRLQEAGFTAHQAEAQAQALWEAIEGTVATKQDLRELEARVDGRFNELEAHFVGRIDSLEARLDGRINELETRFEGRFRLLYGMVGFNLALTLGVLLKLLLG